MRTVKITSAITVIALCFAIAMALGGCQMSQQNAKLAHTIGEVSYAAANAYFEQNCQNFSPTNTILFKTFLTAFRAALDAGEDPGPYVQRWESFLAGS